MPGANELSTVEWHSAQVMPTRVSVSLPLTVSTVPLRPTTASSFSSATVVSGLLRSTLPFWIPSTTAAGNASASTFNPTDSAVVGIDRRADHFMHAQRIGPLRLVAKRVEAKDLLALVDNAGSGAATLVVTSLRRKPPCMRPPGSPRLPSICAPCRVLAFSGGFTTMDDGNARDVPDRFRM